MSAGEFIIFRPGAHPDPAVQDAGFPLHHPYLRRCWEPLIGPVAVEVLRRAPMTWHPSSTGPTNRAELAAELGLRRTPLSRDPLGRTLNRLVRSGFAEWGVFVDFDSPRPAREELVVYTAAAALSARDLARVPSSVRSAHAELLEAHRRELSQLLAPADVRFSSPPRVTDRLRQLERRPSRPGRGLI